MAALAGRQHGRVAWRQLKVISDGRTVRRWIGEGYLFRTLPGVYAVGHAGTSVEAELVEALLFAGPGAELSHDTAVWWRGWLKYPPDRMHVSTPRRVSAPRPRLVVHDRRRLPRDWVRGLPVTTVAQTLLDLASVAKPDLLRFVLANADYDGALDLAGIDALTGRGIAGSAAIQIALLEHRPQLAETRSELERRLLALTAAHDLPSPDRCNVTIAGHLVDAVWDAQRVVVEVDGYRGHRSPAQLRADHRRDLELRALGYLVLRYSWDQVTRTPELVAADLGRALNAPTRSAA